MINFYNIKGERCSGTTYLSKLIDINFNIPSKFFIGWKHGYIKSAHDVIPDNSTTLTLVLFRDPLDWMRSLYLSPHHFKDTGQGRWISDKRPSFSEFIRREIRLEDDFGKEQISDMHPLYLVPPKDIFELRKWKHEHFLRLPNILEHVYFIKYEDLAKNPKEIIDDINNKWFGADYEFKDWKIHKIPPPGKPGVAFTPKKYFDISQEDRDYIAKNLDWELEEKIGYSLSEFLVKE
jgi:hypothetical protein